MRVELEEMHLGETTHVDDATDDAQIVSTALHALETAGITLYASTATLTRLSTSEGPDGDLVRWRFEVGVAMADVALTTTTVANTFFQSHLTQDLWTDHGGSHLNSQWAVVGSATQDGVVELWQ